MDIPVDYGNALDAAVGLRMRDRDRRIRENAEAHSVTAASMVARRTNQRVGIRHGAVDHCVNSCDGTAGRQCCNLVAAMTKG